MWPTPSCRGSVMKLFTIGYGRRDLAECHRAVIADYHADRGWDITHIKRRMSARWARTGSSFPPTRPILERCLQHFRAYGPSRILAASAAARG